MNKTVLLRANHWAVTGGDADQGLYAYVFLGLQSGRGFRLSGEHLDDGTRQTAFVLHFWGGLKPWLTHAECRRYFDFLHNDSGFRHRPSRCMLVLEQRRAQLLRRRDRRPKPCYPQVWAQRVF
eukprot:7204754-Prymnesium_polylepis.1